MSGMRILVVDDEPEFLEMIRSRLEAEQYEVLTVLSGPRALEVIRSDKPDVVLLDITMPGMDGFEVLRRIRRTDKKLPVFILTAFTSREGFRDARKLGASGFLSKTDHVEQELRNVTSALRMASRYQKNAR